MFHVKHSAWTLWCRVPSRRQIGDNLAEGLFGGACERLGSVLSHVSRETPNVAQPSIIRVALFQVLCAPDYLKQEVR